MNERLQGWRLALALLIPAAIIGGAGYLAFGALSDDDQGVATGTDQVVATSTPVPETQPVDDAAAVDPTPVPAPTALTVPTVDPATAPTAVPAATAVPAPTVAPTATTAPAPAATAAPSGPAPTATPDPSIITVACGGTVPASADVGAEFGPLSADTTPAEIADTYTFVWDLGNGNIVTNPTSGTISYAEAGSYTVSVTGTSNDGGPALTANCGTVAIAKVVAPFRVRCSVSVSVADKKLEEAEAPDTMTVTTSWTPIDQPLNLQYEFDTVDDLIIVPNASSGDQQRNSFDTNSSTFSIFWRDPASGETGLLSCPAYPGKQAAEPTATAIAGSDTDDDGVTDEFDNCPAVKNTDQLDTDNDTLGNECDDDDDNDQRLDIFDNCPLDVNFDQADSNFNEIGDACEVAPTPTATTEASGT